VGSIRKTIVAVAMRTGTSMEFLYALPLDELDNIVEEILKLRKGKG